jgi:chromosome segregation ATPase
MGNLSGYGLTGRLIAKHFGKLGDTIAEAIASFDPETATEADRDRLRDALQSAGVKMAEAQKQFDKEHTDVVSLQAEIARDSAAAEKLIAEHDAGRISDDDLNAFCDELETNKARLATEVQEEADAKAYLDEVRKVVDTISKQLTDFDNNAKKAMMQLKQAQAQKDLQAMRQQQQDELNGLKGLAGSSTALSALTRKADKVSNEAAGMKVVADVQQAPIDRADRINAIRAQVEGGATAGESPADRLRRLAGKAAAAA